MSIEQVNVFRREIKKLPKKLRLKWIASLNRHKQHKGAFHGPALGQCCVLGALRHCTYNKKPVEYVGETFEKYGAFDNNPSEDLFQAAASLNDHGNVSFPQFVDMIRESLHA